MRRQYKQGRRHGVDRGGHVQPTFARVVPESDANLVFLRGRGESVRSDSVSFVTVVEL